nr:putative transposase, mutator type, MULE transposase domain protein [Tanacetum cinerariifolium]
MVRDYVGELPSTNPNTIVKIAVDRDTYPLLHTRVFKILYVCLGALNYEFRAWRREVLGLDGTFINGPFSGQVLAAVAIDPNNIIYPLAYALVEAKSKSSWSWFLMFLGDDIDLEPNSNFTFICDRKKGSLGVAKPTRMLCRDANMLQLLMTLKEAIKKKDHVLKVEWNKGVKYQVSWAWGDQCVRDAQSINNVETSGNGSGQVSQVDAGVGQANVGHGQERMSPNKTRGSQPSSQP